MIIIVDARTGGVEALFAKRRPRRPTTLCPGPDPADEPPRLSIRSGEARPEPHSGPPLHDAPGGTLPADLRDADPADFVERMVGDGPCGVTPAAYMPRHG
jgi:hypothetical protein